MLTERISRVFVLCLALAVAFTSVPLPIAAQDILPNNNLIVNGDFRELGADGRPVGWTLSNQGSEYRAFVDSNGHGGLPAIRLGGGEEEGYTIINQKDISAKDYLNKKLRITAWYKGSDVRMRAKANNFLRVEFFQSTGGKLKAVRDQLLIPAPAGSTDWMVLESEFTVPPETDVLWVSFYLKNSSGTVSLSGLEMREARDETMEDKISSTYYVSPDGDDNQVGTKQHPWASLGKASREAGPGDTVILLPGAYAGGSNILAPKRSGTPDAPITFRAEERRTAVLTGAGGAEYAIVLDGVSHIRLEGLHVSPTSPTGRWFLAQRAKDIHLTDMLMERGRDAVQATPFLIADSEDIFVRDSDLKRSPFNMAVVQRSHRILFEGNAISYAGHSPLQFYDGTEKVYDTEVVLRGNVFNPTWGRAFEFLMARNTLFENNIIIHSLHGGRSASEASQPVAFEAIYRFNRIYRNWGNPIVMHPWLDVHGVTDSRIYNNVFDRNNLEALRIIERTPSSPVRDNVVKNNIFNDNDPYGERRQIVLSQGAQHVRFEHNALGEAGKIGFPDLASLTPDDVQSEKWQGGRNKGQFQSNFQGPVGFVNPELYDHRLLATSPLRDAAAPLTYAASDGSGQLLPVEDVHYFYDGFGIQGERGDLIAVGDSARVARVTAINVEASTLVLDRALTWKEGDPVSLAWSGPAPDMGPIEYGETGRVSVFVEVDPFFVYPGEPVTMRAHVYGAIDPVSYEWRLGDGTLAYGQEITHTYEFSVEQLFSPEGFPIRVRVTDKDGASYVGVGFVEYGPPTDLAVPLMHTTFDRDDQDAWWIWYPNRPTPVDWDREVDRETGEGVLRVTNPGGGTMPLHTNPAHWDIDLYPLVYMRYRISPGTPVGVYLRGFDADAKNERRVLVASALPKTGTKAGELLPYRLIADGDWHTLVFDARMIRDVYPDVTVIRRLGMEAVSASKAGDTYWLDEVAILSEQAADSAFWEERLCDARGARPWQTVRIESLEGWSVHGELPIVAGAVLPSDERASSYTLRVWEIANSERGGHHVLYQGPTWPGTVLFDSKEVEDGMYELEFTVETDRGTSYDDVRRIIVNNWATLADDLLPPSDSGWFGTVEMLAVSDKSEGWQHAVGEPETFFGDEDRLVPAVGEIGYLTWSLPRLRQFEVTAFTQDPAATKALTIAVSADGEEWSPLAYQVSEQDVSAESGWSKLVLSGNVPESLNPGLIRLTWDGTQANSTPIQLGRVFFVGAAQ